MKLFLEIPDSTWETINELVGAKPENTVPARDFIIRACARAIIERKKLMRQRETDIIKINQIVAKWQEDKEPKVAGLESL
jgi:hypothetical protein